MPGMTQLCGVKDGDYGTCNLLAGHPGRWHHEMRDGKLWAEWSGPPSPAPPVDDERERFLTSPATPEFLAAVEEVRAVFAGAPGTEATRLRIALASVYPDIFAAGRAAATPDLPKDERRPWPIAPDTVMPSRRQPVRWGSRADDPPTEIHDDPEKTKAYLAGLAAGRTEAAAASPDERLREADRAALVESIAQTERFRGGPCLCSDCVEKRADAEATVDAVLAALAATDRDKQEGER